MSDKKMFAALRDEEQLAMLRAKLERSEKSPLVENFSIDALIDELDQEHKISMLEDALEEGENSGESTRSFEDIVKEAIATSRLKGKP